MYKAIVSTLTIAAIACCGCKSTGFLAKREAEKCCPTDIRKTVPWCAGEDAIFQCPCEPSSAFYGYKPTCWRTWPTGGATWRDIHCGNEHHQALIGDLTHQNPELIELPPLQSLPAPSQGPNTAEKQEAGSEAAPTKAEDTLPATDDSESRKQKDSIDVPTLKKLPEPQANLDIVLEKDQAVSSQQPEAIDDLSPRPILGPIPLPPVEAE